MHYYHPNTLEHINTTSGADWMSTTDVPVPTYNPQTEGCFFENGAWVVKAEQPGLAEEELAAQVRAERDYKIAQVSWKYERYAREVRLGLTPTDDIAKLDTYVQALANIPAQTGFPSNVVWPVF